MDKNSQQNIRNIVYFELRFSFSNKEDFGGKRNQSPSFKKISLFHN